MQCFTSAAPNSTLWTEKTTGNAVVHILSIVVCLQGIGKKENPQIASN